MKEVSKAEESIKKIEEVENYYRIRLNKNQLLNYKIHLDTELEVKKQSFINVATLSFGALVMGQLISRSFDEEIPWLTFVLIFLFVGTLIIIGSVFYGQFRYVLLRKAIIEKLIAEHDKKQERSNINRRQLMK